MNKLYSPLLLLGLAAFAGSASAANDGWYVGIDLGQSNYAQMGASTTDTSQGLVEQGLPNTPSETSTATAYGVDVGYQFFRYLAVEGGYTDFGSPSANFAINLVPPGNATIKIHATGETLFAVGILPVTDSFQLFGKLGILAYSQDLTGNVSVVGAGSAAIPKESDSGTTPAIGVGANFDFNPQFGLRLGFTRFHAVGNANSTGQGTIDLSYLQFVAHF